jgi:hypothetical protein
LDGAELTFIRIDYQARLQFGDTEIVIETPFTLTAANEERTLDPNDREGLGPFLALYPGSLASAAVDANLALHLSFAGGTAITVPQHSKYESWHVVGPGTRLIVCPPAGNRTLAIWR